MSMAAVLENMYPVSEMSRGKASSILASVGNGNPAIIVKNNAPYRVITTTENYLYLSELEEDIVLLAEAVARLEANRDKEPIPASEVYAKYGIDPAEIAAMDDVEIE